MSFEDLAPRVYKFKALLRRLGAHRNNLMFLFLLYSLFIGLAGGVAILIGKVFETFGISRSIEVIVIKAVFTLISLYIPVILSGKEEELNREDGITPAVIDLSIGICLSSIVIVWAA